jgi:adenylate cyclase class 2
METEFEAKFFPIDKTDLRARLKKIGAKLQLPERKMKRIIGDTRVNPNLPKNSFIRVRDEGEGVVRLSLKVSAVEGGSFSDQKEIEVSVSSFEDTVSIFEAAGIKFNRLQETTREEWEYRGAQITIDTWPGLPPYSEIESDSEESVNEIADELGFDWDRKIITAIAEIYEKYYGISIDKVLEKISNISFENNSFEGMKQVWFPENH